MNETPSNVLSTINNLIQTCKDGQEGFREASENVDDPELKHLLAEYSMQRSQFAGVLQNAALYLGDHDPKDSGSVGGAIHRGWINLKAAIAGRDRYKILSECEAGEDTAVKEYRKALELALPSDITATISEQFAEIQTAHDQIRALRDGAKLEHAHA